MRPIKSQSEYNELSEVEEMIQNLVWKLEFEIVTDVKKKTLRHLNALQESIFEKRHEYQQNQLRTLKTA